MRFPNIVDPKKKKGSLREIRFVNGIRYGDASLPNKPISEKVNIEGQKMLKKYPPTPNRK